MILLLLALAACLPPLVEPSTEDNPADDFDRDGETEEEGDCDDADPLKNSTTVWYADRDHDGFGDPTVATIVCEPPTGAVSDDTDCDDTRDDRFPGAEEACTGEDLDCDGRISEPSPWYRDGDSDGYGDAGTSQVACDAPAGYVANDEDCRDADPDAYPGADETCNDLDDDCDDTLDEDAVDAGRWYPDVDGDGFGDDGNAGVTACDAPNGWVSDNTDCNDGKDTIHPGAAETNILVDEDCDGDVLN